jgi:thiol-disulfide isomerase/thioredoxin
VLRLQDLKGKAVLLNLWATWCEPCRAELPELLKLHEQYAASGLVVVGVSLDQTRTAEEIRRFVAQRKLPYTMLWDPKDEASKTFDVETLPATFLYDGERVLRWRKVGAVTGREDTLHAAIRAALSGP